MGFDSTKFTFMKLSSAVCSARAAAKSPASAALTIFAIRSGTTFDATEITPRPPTAISGRAIASSPDSTVKFDGTSRQTSHCCVMLPEASFTPTMFSMAASRASVRGSTLQAGARRHVVDDDRELRVRGRSPCSAGRGPSCVGLL
jgi:hypothetical protein